MLQPRFRFLALSLALALGWPALPTAAAELHGYSVIDGELLRFDLLTGDYETIGPTGIPARVPGLADGDGGSFFGVARNLAPLQNSLYRIDRATGQGTLIGTPSLLPGDHLARTADGALYNAHFEGGIYRVDPSTATPTLLIDLDRTLWSMTAKGGLLHVAYSVDLVCHLATIDPADPVLVPTGQLAFCANTSAIGHHDGNIYYASLLSNIIEPEWGTLVEMHDLGTGEVRRVAEWFGPISTVKAVIGLAGVTGQGETVEVPVSGAAGRLLLAALLALAALAALRRR